MKEEFVNLDLLLHSVQPMRTVDPHDTLLIGLLASSMKNYQKMGSEVMTM